MTRIAVAVPTYARPDYLARLVDTIPDTATIYISDNDASLQDRVPALPAHASVSHSASLIPMFANWNRALSLVDRRHTHVLVPSDDDLYLPGAFDRVEAAIVAHPDVDILVFGCDVVDEHDVVTPAYRPQREEILAPGDGFLKFRYSVAARMPGVVLRLEFLDRIGNFDERFELTASDSELVQRALLLGRSAFVPDVIGLYRIWSGSLTHARQATDLWMSEVMQWTDKIAALLSNGHQPSSGPIDVATYRDEVLAQNLLAGVHNLMRKQERVQARAFLRRHGIPRHATMRTRMMLLRCLLKLWAQRA